LSVIFSNLLIQFFGRHAIQAVYRGTMPTLHAPTKRVFFISLLLVVIAWMSTYIGDHPSALVTLAYIVLALGCFW
jgi:hypothetical protein